MQYWKNLINSPKREQLEGERKTASRIKKSLYNKVTTEKETCNCHELINNEKESMQALSKLIKNRIVSTETTKKLALTPCTCYGCVYLKTRFVVYCDTPIFLCGLIRKTKNYKLAANKCRKYKKDESSVIK